MVSVDAKERSFVSLFRPKKQRFLMKISVIGKKYNYVINYATVDMFSFVFWRKLKTPKKPLRNDLTLSRDSNVET